MPTVDELMGAMQKEYGANVVNKGFKFSNTGRLQTGIFPFDFATGGGFPMGKVSLVFGPSSSLKSTITCRAIGMAQRMFPEKRAVLVDPEGTYDPEWAASQGVITDELAYSVPDFAEQGVDIVEGLLAASDVSIVVLDSIASMVPSKEIEEPGDKMIVGTHSLLMGKLYRKSLVALNNARKEGNYPVFLAVNQIRHKIGVMHGNPETMPGGNAFPFGASLSVRLYGKEETDTKVHPNLHVWKVCDGIIKKHKIPVLANTFTFKMAKINGPGVMQGQVYDWNTVIAYMKELGYITQEKKKWNFLGNVYPTLKMIKEHLEGDLEHFTQIKGSLIQEALKKI